MKRLYALKLFLLLFFTQLGLSQTTVYDIIADSPDHNTLEAAVDAAGLNTALQDNAASLTVFAPTDEAFAALGSVVDDLLMDPMGELSDILLYHVLGAEVASGTITNGLIVEPLNAANTLKITKTSDGMVFINQALVTVTDLPADNGTVHVIDAVLLPTETVVDVAIDNGFSTLTTAVVAAELLPALTDPFASFTVFAPTDDAFAALGSTVDDLLMDPTGALRDILLYHVLGSKVAAADVTNGLIAEPLNNTNSLKFTATSTGDVFVNQAQVALPDVGADNGIVHVIDAVVLPNETVVDV
ncbi:MAG: fasciclin domain-containing protein, partial [Bacteroidia bacterium]|nr:fasciclin domain-containing protein [Bacteroidia bacterium]